MDQAEVERLRRAVLAHRPPRRVRVWRSWRAPAMQELWRKARQRVGWRRAWVQRIRRDWRWLWAYTFRPVLVDPVQRRAGPA